MSTLRGRLRHPEHAVDAGATAVARERRASILEHLQQMCATRLGSLPACPEYGVPNVPDVLHSFPTGIDVFAQALKRSIERYESRLCDVEIVHVPNDTPELVLRYEITARLVDEDVPIRFETAVDTACRVRVR